MRRSVQLGLGILFLATLGCASNPAPTDTGPTDSPTDAVTEGSIEGKSQTTSHIDSDTSDVLARKTRPETRCPKRAKLVKGKCVLPVEETE